MTVTEKVISDTSIKIQIYVSQRQLSLLLLTKRKSPPFSSSFKISFSLFKLFYRSKSNTTASLLFPRTGISNRYTSDFRNARKEVWGCFFSFFFSFLILSSRVIQKCKIMQRKWKVSYSEQKDGQLDRKYVLPKGKM